MDQWKSKNRCDGVGHQCLLHTENGHYFCLICESRLEISNTVVCATSKASDQPAHTRSRIRAFASRLKYATDRISVGVSKPIRRLHRFVWVYTCQNATCWKSYVTAQIYNVLFNSLYARLLLIKITESSGPTKRRVWSRPEPNTLTPCWQFWNDCSKAFNLKMQK